MDNDDDELKGILLNYFYKKNFSNLKISDDKLQIRGEKMDPNMRDAIS